MSLELAREINRRHPELLQENIGAMCHMYTVYLIELLRGNGHKAFHVCKTKGEGQYIPYGFQPRVVKGLDGKDYTITGVSHDAIWCDGEIVDTVGSGNEHDRPIYRREGDPNWSFDPNDGPQITGSPVWNVIPKEYWRPGNPPLLPLPVIVTPEPPPSKILPKGEAFAALKALNAFYQAPEGLQRPGGLVLPDGEGRSIADMEAIAQWFYQLVIEGIPLDAVFAQIRNSQEWREKHP